MTLELKQPPHSLQAEQAVIGAVLLDGSLAGQIELPESDFYRREHRLIWQAIQALAKDDEAVDALTVADKLVSMNLLHEAGGLDYLSSIVTGTGSTANFEHYAQIVHERAQERQLITVGHRIADSGFNANGRSVADRVAEASKAIAAIETTGGDELVDMNTMLKEAVHDFEYRFENQGKIHGLSTGFRDIDAKLNGAQPGDLLIVGARPSVGKSAFVINICTNILLQDKSVLFYSLEMPRRQIMTRLFASVGGVPNERIKKGTLTPDDWDRISSAAGKLKGKKLWIDDTPNRTSNQIRAAIRRHITKHGETPAFVAIDYMQLMRDGVGKDRQSDISEISRNLKLIAREYGTVVCALSQLNRGVEQRANKRPVMSDLRESGAIEQDADVIMLLYRDRVYNPNSADENLEVNFAKLREGEIGTVYLRSNLGMSRFETQAHTYQVGQYQQTVGGLN